MNLRAHVSFAFVLVCDGPVTAIYLNMGQVYIIYIPVQSIV